MTARPEDVGLSSERLARIDSHLKRRYLDPEKIAGALTLVYRRGQIAWLSPLGLMDREAGKPTREDTIYRIYSMSKPVTSVALMQLYEHGHFQLDDPVYKSIPSWRDLRVFQAGRYPDFATTACERPMTIRDLLTHQSGLTYGFMMRTNVDAAYRRLRIGTLDRAFDGDLQDMIDRLATLPLEFSPGSHWNYSVSTDVCGHLVEHFSGEPLDEYLRRHVFEPLGMPDTGFQVAESEWDRFAANYQRGPDKKLVRIDDPTRKDAPYRKRPRFLGGGGGLVSTAHDYLRFCRMLLGGGELEGARILGPRTLALMTRNHITGGRTTAEAAVGGYSEVAAPGTGFGLGFSVTLDPVQSGVVGSSGEFAWGGAASTVFWIDPAEELIVIFMTQFMPSRTFNFRGQLKSIIYGAITD